MFVLCDFQNASLLFDQHYLRVSCSHCSIASTSMWYACPQAVQSAPAGAGSVGRPSSPLCLSCVAAHIMAVEPTRSPSKEAEISDTEEAIVPPSQSSSSASDAHNAAAAENAKQKGAKKNGNAEKRKADKVLTMPQSSSVSDLQISLQEAKSKRDAAKKEAKIETNKVKLARKRVERVKAKARVLSNNDLYEVYILRMQEEAKKNAAKK